MFEIAVLENIIFADAKTNFAVTEASAPFPPSQQADLEGAATTRVSFMGPERKQSLLGTVSIND